MSKSEKIGRTAFILYRGGIAGEHVLDDRSFGEPLKVILGENAVPKGIEAAVFDMDIGECRDIVIEPDEGFGYPSPDGIQWYPKTMIKNGETLALGDTIACADKYRIGETLPGLVVAKTADMLQINVNHPFAGKTLAYWINLVDLV